ncbi:thymidylate kinase [Streptomyces polygonati]|uniref:Thymidylate kinase n=1 Tax=Streptomyces polygonati TaxID=1617087 RepID=A0ABV8HTR4_9ACTN
MIVSLVGTDGAGKSSVSREVSARLAAAGLTVEHVDRWDIVDNPAYPSARFMRPDVPDTRLCVAEMPNPVRFLFLMWSIAAALLARIPAAAGPGTLTLLDGYWMKHAASEIVYGLDRSWAESVTAGLPRSELVVQLRVEPEQAWERKVGRDVVPYECGMDPSCSRGSFLDHQRRILALMDDWARQHDWVVLDAGADLATVVDQVTELVRSAAPAGRRASEAIA